MNKFDLFLDSKSSLGDGTWRDWLVEILDTLFVETEHFSGKHPCGYNSDWHWELAHALSATIDPKIENGEDINWPLAEETFRRVVKHALGVKT